MLFKVLFYTVKKPSLNHYISDIDFYQSTTPGLNGEMYIFLAIKVCQSRLVEGTAIDIFLVLKGCFPSEKERNISLVKKRAIQVEEKQVLKSVNPVEWKAIFISLILKLITRVKQKAMYISLVVKRVAQWKAMQIGISLALRSKKYYHCSYCHDASDNDI